MSWLETLLDFLNMNDGTITALATVVLVCITTWYARMTKENVRLTKEYVRLTKEMLKATNKPEVILFLRYEEGLISICIENIGTGYASDVKFTGDLLFYKAIRQSHEKEGKLINELPPFKNGIFYLGSGQKINTLPLFSIYADGKEDIPKRPVTIKVSYKDSTDTPENKKFSFEPSNWQDGNQFISPTMDETANELSKIASLLEDIRIRN